MTHANELSAPGRARTCDRQLSLAPPLHRVVQLSHDVSRGARSRRQNDSCSAPPPWCRCRHARQRQPDHHPERGNAGGTGQSPQLNLGDNMVTLLVSQSGSILELAQVKARLGRGAASASWARHCREELPRGPLAALDLFRRSDVFERGRQFLGFFAGQGRGRFDRAGHRQYLADLAWIGGKAPTPWQRACRPGQAGRLPGTTAAPLPFGRAFE